MQNFCRKLHRYLALIVGLVFLMMCLTGAIMVFEEQFTDACYASRRLISPPDTPALSADSLALSLAPRLDEGVEIKSIRESEKPDQAWKVFLTKPKGAALFVNQYTGEVVADASRPPFFASVQALHRWLLDKPKDGKSAGKSVIGWCAIAYFIILMSGLHLWWPRSRAMVRSRFAINFKSKGAFWFSSHAVCGFYALPVLLVIVLTGLTWSFPWWSDFMKSIFGDVSFKPAHMGFWAALPGQIIWLIAVLLGSWLPISGFYNFFRLRRKKSNPSR